jgi:hypothetical protein
LGKIFKWQDDTLYGKVFKWLDRADGCQLGTLNMASIGFSLNNFFFSMNSFPLVHIDNYQRRSPFRLLGGTRSRPDIVISGRT